MVKLADKVAYINHDIEDALRAGVLSNEDIPFQCTYVLGRTKSERISTIIHSVVEHSSDDIRMDSEVQQAHDRLKAFMFEQVYKNSTAKSEEGKAEEVVKILYRYLIIITHTRTSCRRTSFRSWTSTASAGPSATTLPA